MKLYSYKDLHKVPLSKIHACYGIPEVPLLLFRQRVYKNMDIKTALYTPKSEAKNKNSPYQKYLRALYNKWASTQTTPAKKAVFFDRLSRGYAPNVAILPPVKHKKQVKIKKATSNVSAVSIMKNKLHQDPLYSVLNKAFTSTSNYI